MLWLLYATNNAFQFLEFTSVMGPIVQFYQVTEDQVLWMSGVTFISQGAGALPVAFMAEILTLRTSVITGLVTSIVGCVIKNCAVQSNLYWLLFTGQLISQFS